MTCPECKGSGRVWTDWCGTCNGEGEVTPVLRVTTETGSVYEFTEGLRRVRRVPTLVEKRCTNCGRNNLFGGDQSCLRTRGHIPCDDGSDWTPLNGETGGESLRRDGEWVECSGVAIPLGEPMRMVLHGLAPDVLKTVRVTSRVVDIVRVEE